MFVKSPGAFFMATPGHLQQKLVRDCAQSASCGLFSHMFDIFGDSTPLELPMAYE